jgi:hypothetical protein
MFKTTIWVMKGQKKMKNRVLSDDAEQRYLSSQYQRSIYPTPSPNVISQVTPMDKYTQQSIRRYAIIECPSTCDNKLLPGHCINAWSCRSELF